VGAKEVVMGDEERGQRQGTVGGGEAAGGADMVLVSAIKALDELFEGAKFGRDDVEVLQTDHLPQGVRGLRGRAVSVEEVDPSLISGVAVGDETESLILGQGASRFAQGHGGGQGIAAGSHVIGRDLVTPGIEE